MLRITEISEPGATVLRVEGRLVPPWVEELATCCSRAAALRSEKLVVDLRSVTFVGSEGKTLLGRIYRDGARLITAGTLMTGVVEEIKQQIHPQKDCNHG